MRQRTLEVYQTVKDNAANKASYADVSLALSSRSLDPLMNLSVVDWEKEITLV